MVDRLTAVYLLVVALLGLTYCAFELTPSSYGQVLIQIQAPDEGPLCGTPRYIRSDEWALTTPFFQACVNNGFRRVNETSFYREDLRSQSIPIGLPIRDWCLVFKPQLWPFFVVPPALAYSAFWALMLCGSLAGYQLLFRHVGVAPLLAAAVAVMVVFSGYSQFWWTTFAPLIAGFPWLLLITLSRRPWWQKALLFTWLLPVWAVADLYPGLVIELAFAFFLVILALRPELLRDPRELAAIAIGGIAMVLVVYLYYRDIIPTMQNTIYPGRRIAEPGTATWSAVLSQFLPYLAFRLGDYANLVGDNICEIGAVGSFLPLLTLCLTRYKDLRSDPVLHRALTILAAGLLLMTFWQVADAPRWLGHVLQWERVPAQRSLLVSGLLITIASLLVWTHQRISLDPVRIVLFVLLGPVATILFKLGFYQTGIFRDLGLCAVAIAAAAIACLVAVPLRPAVLFYSMALINVYAFGRFNPVQRAGPIFQTPDTDIVRQTRLAENSSPDHILIDQHFLGATANGMGFRSVSHALMTPILPLFRSYFPTMDPVRFNQVFNRFSYIKVTDDPLPNSTNYNLINVPGAAFEPVRNLREVSAQVVPRQDCSTQRGGAVDRVALQGDRLILEGWAPWKGEDKSQELHLSSARVFRVIGLVTIKRPDVAEKLKDYRYVRAGFRLSLSSADGQPFRPEELVLVARHTEQGLAQLAGCGCP